MDLSWCIICDNRIDSNLNESDLYCSDACKVKDSSLSTTTSASGNSSSSSSNNSMALFGQSPPKQRTIKNTLTLLRNRQQRPTAPSTSYPWIPLYRRRPIISRRPAVAASGVPPTTTSMLCRKPSTSTTSVASYHYRPNLTAV